MIGRILSALGSDLPTFDSLDEGINYILPYVSRFGEDLYETEFYVGQRWREVREDVHFQEEVLHIFQEDGEYLRIMEGEISSGAWSYSFGGIRLQYAGDDILYEKVFLNDSLFILAKRGDIRTEPYWVLATPSWASREWPAMLEIWFELYRSNLSYLLMVGFFLFLAAVIVFFSVM